MVNKATLDLIKKYEGLRLKAYKDSGSVWTIGYGHTSDSYFSVGPGTQITEEKAEELLRYDLKEAENAVINQTFVDLNDNQYGALVSFTYNLGGGNYKRSTLRKKLNKGDYASVPAELNKWVHDDGQRLTGLVRRRKAEGELFVTPASATPKKASNPLTALLRLFMKMLGFK